VSPFLESCSQGRLLRPEPRCKQPHQPGSEQKCYDADKQKKKSNNVKATPDEGQKTFALLLPMQAFTEKENVQTGGGSLLDR